jgi:hypothetical protein
LAGNFDCESLSKILDAPSHNVRQALQASGIDIDANDSVPVEVFDKNRDKLQKYLDDQAKARLAEKKAAADWADTKAKWLAEHNKKVGAASEKES